MSENLVSGERTALILCQNRADRDSIIGNLMIGRAVPNVRRLLFVDQSDFRQKFDISFIGISLLTNLLVQREPGKSVFENFRRPAVTKSFSCALTLSRAGLLKITFNLTKAHRLKLDCRHMNF